MMCFALVPDKAPESPRRKTTQDTQQRRQGTNETYQNAGVAEW